jgi:hypothetical protein
MSCRPFSVLFVCAIAFLLPWAAEAQITASAWVDTNGLNASIGTQYNLNGSAGNIPVYAPDCSQSSNQGGEIRLAWDPTDTSNADAIFEPFCSDSGCQQVNGSYAAYVVPHGANVTFTCGSASAQSDANWTVVTQVNWGGLGQFTVSGGPSTGPILLPYGLNGQVLTSNGSGSSPSWADPVGPSGPTGATGPTGFPGLNEVYSLDLTDTSQTLDNVTLSDGVTDFANGQQWTVTGIGSGATIKVNPTAGSGIVMQQATYVANGQNYDVGITGPSLTSLGSGNINPWWVPTTAYWFHISATPPTSTAGGGTELQLNVFITNNGTGNDAYFAQCGNVAGQLGAYGGYNGDCIMAWLEAAGTLNGGNSVYTTNNMGDNVMVLQASSMNSWMVWSGVWSDSTGWPAWNTLNFRGMVQG